MVFWEKARIPTKKLLSEETNKRKGKRKRKQETSTKATLTSKKPDENSDTHFEDDASEEEDSEFEEITLSTKHSENEEHTPKNVKRAKLMTPELKAALDRAKMSDREVVFTIAATTTSLGHDINDLTLSVSTLRRANG